MKFKALPTVAKPHSIIERALAKEGFQSVHTDRLTDFVATFEDLSTSETYRVYIPAFADKPGITKLKLHAAYFEEKDWIPHHISQAVLSKLQEMADYLLHSDRQSRRRTNVVNTMAPNEEELTRLGNEMKSPIL
jgi:hypothetical protein